MDLTARVLHEAEFREAKRGGYNTQDVDEFLERLAVAVDRQDAALREARQRLAAAEQHAAEAEHRLEELERRGPGPTSDADETLKRTLVLAQRTADAAIREAEERAARMVAAAEDEAARLLAEAHEATAQAYADAEEEARRAQHAARSRVLAELQELEGAREVLRGDVDLLERHIEEQRDRLRVSIRELQAIVEDPAALREVPVPDLTPVEIPQPEPELEARPERHGGRLVAPPAEDLHLAEHAEDEDDYGPVQGPTPRGRGGSRTAHDEARQGPRPLLADARRLAAEEAEEDEDDDEYLTELRKAMSDDRPLGPRDEPDDDGYEEAPAVSRSRFGRRR
jgi:DivIVA domain-containing protein